MFRFIKSLFGETRPAEPVQNSSNHTTAEVDPSAPRLPLDTTHTAAYPVSAPAGPALEIPLHAVVERFSPVLRTAVARTPSRQEVVRLDLDAVLEQLPRGAVRVPFRAVKQASPPGIFAAIRDLDDVPVDVPLAEVLPRLTPTCLARRPEQKRLSVPDDLPLVFTGRSGDAPAATRHASVSAAGVASATLQNNTTAARPIAAPALQPKTAAHAAPLHSSVQSQPAVTIKGPDLHPNPPVAHRTEAQAPQHGAVPPPSPSTGHGTEPLKVPLVQLARNWPEPLRKEVMARHLGASLILPYAEVESALRRGKAVFSWKQLRQWMTAKVSGPLTEHDELSVELPLPVLTPLFLARRPVSERVRTLAPSADIPDVFNTRPASGAEAGAGTISLSKAMPAPAAVAASESRSAAATVKADISAPAAPIRMERHAPLEPAPALPADAVQRACQLKGVAGALIGTPDGLVIASRWPAPLNADIAAGFLPQVFSRLGQATAELKLGEVGQVEMVLGTVPLLILKLSTAYFAVLGKAGEPLPKTPLCALAGQLSQRNN